MIKLLILSLIVIIINTAIIAPNSNQNKNGDGATQVKNYDNSSGSSNSTEKNKQPVAIIASSKNSGISSLQAMRAQLQKNYQQLLKTNNPIANPPSLTKQNSQTTAIENKNLKTSLTSLKDDLLTKYLKKNNLTVNDSSDNINQGVNNSIIGKKNAIVGDNNYITGFENEVDGSKNEVIGGSKNIVQGNGNIIMDQPIDFNLFGIPSISNLAPLTNNKTEGEKLHTNQTKQFQNQHNLTDQIENVTNQNNANDSQTYMNKSVQQIRNITQKDQSINSNQTKPTSIKNQAQITNSKSLTQNSIIDPTTNQTDKSSQKVSNNNSATYIKMLGIVLILLMVITL